ncbi:hypothetical protein KKD04_01240 [Patescibacteria group bacterium]|nr:hypothetical protein [Patescibacteria group bacterium]
MKILGINQIPGMFAWQHDSAAALIKNGKLVAMSEEERFNRTRHSRGYPHKAINFCLKKGNIKMQDLDIIAISYNPYAFLKRFPVNFYWRSLLQNILNLGLFWYFKWQIKSQTKAKIVFIDHHLAHAASAFRCSGFEKANIFTIDGSGETESFAFFIGENGKIKRVWDIPFDNFWSTKKWKSIGLVYSRVTNFLGLGTNGEGKTMGLASYGKPVYDFSRILKISNHKNYYIDRRNVSKLYKELERKNADDPLSDGHKNLAASLQNALEESIVNLAKEANNYSKIKNFCLAGGVALNCNANSRILDQDFCDNIFIQPAANDAGAALGAALEAGSFFEKPINFKLEHAYWGADFSDNEIEKTLKESKLNYKKVDNIEEAAAKLITQGRIIGWFQGAMEMGPRALGNRSIIANPAIKGINDKVNNYVKHRERWRPFAPSVAEEDATEYFEGVEKISESPFMLHTFFVKEKYRGIFPAITHVDGSSRIQTVNKKQNEKYYKLLKELEKINKYPIVLNTSFNDKGEPIVCTPKDAIRCFFSTGLDALAIGNFLLEK